MSATEKQRRSKVKKMPRKIEKKRVIHLIRQNITSHSVNQPIETLLVQEPVKCSAQKRPLTLCECTQKVDRVRAEHGDLIRLLNGSKATPIGFGQSAAHREMRQETFGRRRNHCRRVNSIKMTDVQNKEAYNGVVAGMRDTLDTIKQIA